MFTAGRPLPPPEPLRRRYGLGFSRGHVYRGSRKREIVFVHGFEPGNFQASRPFAAAPGYLPEMW